MKRIIITSVFVIIGLGSAQAQLAIGLDKVSTSSVSLEFGVGSRGLLLPWVTKVDDVSGVANGTLVFDHNDNKVKVKYNSGWKDLSVSEDGTTVNPNTSEDGWDIQNNLTDSPTAQVRIGEAESPVVPGILVLSDTDKAMVLPKVTNVDDVMNPAPGMMVFVTSTKMLALFNGNKWAFWETKN